MNSAEGPEAALLRLPPSVPGLAIGLFGGSFDPPHEGHLLVAETALRRLALDRLWWMVTPGNPLKAPGTARPLAERAALSHALTRDPRMIVTGFEAGFSTRYTADTLAELARRRPGVRFVWIMGADSLRTFHRWQNWQRIAETYPIAVVDRPGATLAALSAPMARRYAAFRLSEADAPLLPRLRAPAWVFLHGPRSPASSTAIRRAAQEKRR